MKVPSEALALIGAASKEEARYQLCGVHFERNGHLRATSTDGKQLTRMTWKDTEGEAQDGEFSAILANESLRALKKAIGKGESFELTEDSDVGREVIRRTAIMDSGRFDVECIDGSFPNADFVFDRQSRYEERELRINPFILMDQLKTIIGALGMKRNDDKPFLDVRVGKGKGFASLPFLFEGENKERGIKVKGAVMPVVAS